MATGSKAPGSGAEPERLRRLHGGRHSLPAEIVAHNQRERLLAAMAAVCAEQGYNQATISHITEAAGVSRRTFYEHFENKEECFLAAYDALDSHLATLLSDAGGAAGDWPDRVAAGLAAVISYLASHPRFARLYLLEAAAVGEAMVSRREASAERLVELLREGRAAAGRRDLNEGVEEALVGGIFTLLGRRIVAGRAETLGELLPAALEFALVPFLGIDEARAVARRHTA